MQTLHKLHFCNRSEYVESCYMLICIPSHSITLPFVKVKKKIKKQTSTNFNISFYARELCNKVFFHIYIYFIKWKHCS